MSRKNLSVKIKIPKFFRDNLKNKKISTIYKRFEKNLNIDEKFAVAVSGGPDSLALAFLAKVYFDTLKQYEESFKIYKRLLSFSKNNNLLPRYAHHRV